VWDRPDLLIQFWSGGIVRRHGEEETWVVVIGQQPTRASHPRLPLRRGPYQVPMTTR
jgi:hypothetical protein